MARTGLYKSEVKKARDALIAHRKHPSVDAVRVALGNTGSKTTIHKYLKELEEEGSAGSQKASISDALQDFVERLAAQLHAEADVRVADLRTQSEESARRQDDVIAALQKDGETLRQELQNLEAVITLEQGAHEVTKQAFQHETIARHTLEQQVADGKDRLADNEMHRQSLEEKHRHAHEALEHYRQSVKEQRDQDQRRHEQQVQQLQAEQRQLQQSLVVKQEEVTRLNREGVRLVADLSHAQKALYDEQTIRRHLEQKLEALLAAEQRGRQLEGQLAEKNVQVQELKGQLRASAEKTASVSAQLRDLELALASAQAKLEGQQQMMSELRADLRKGSQPTDRETE